MLLAKPVYQIVMGKTGYIGQIGLILAIAYCGHLAVTGLSVPLPSSVVGLLLLLAGLRLGVVAEAWIGDAAHFLSANMAFFFLPSAVEIIENYDRIHPVLVRLLAVCIISTVVTFLAAYWSVRILQGLVKKGGRE
ncbi:MAG: CidA/LrgA family protein [Planctomycetaceae bacterium]|nr:CidA/LrgA family protein [Planctomycetaceae bacterium]